MGDRSIGERLVIMRLAHGTHEILDTVIAYERTRWSSDLIRVGCGLVGDEAVVMWVVMVVEV